MPGGVCAGNNAFLEASAARCAEVDINVLGKIYKVFLGGVAKAGFPDKTTEQLSALEPGDHFSVEWESAFFYGEDLELGPVYAELLPRDLIPSDILSISEVRSLAPANGAVADGNNFFPAINRNGFMFRFKLPRYDLILDSVTPLINEATINAIPPMNTPYQLIEPARFRVNRVRSGPLSNFLAENEIILESCNVKLMELEGISANIQVLGDDGDAVTFEFSFLNETTESDVQMTWLLWPRPEVPTQQAEGVLRLRRYPVTTQVSLPRDLFFRSRWLAVSLSEPFQTNAATAERFPSLI